jgi:phosphonate transport system permease protein
MRKTAANVRYRLPPPIWSARSRAAWLLAGVLALVIASFASLDLKLASLASGEALAGMGQFLAEFVPPDLSPAFVAKVAVGAWETLAMSALGTLLAVAAGLAMALPASRLRGPARAGARLLLNGLRSVPELVWAAMLLISAGLGPFAGTLALAIHTSGVLGRLFAEAIENAPPGPGAALRVQGAGALRVFLYGGDVGLNAKTDVLIQG